MLLLPLLPPVGERLLLRLLLRPLPVTPLRRPVKLTAPQWLRRTALVMSGVFAWSMVLSIPVTALTHMPAQKRIGVRPLSPMEMQHLFGQTTPSVPQAGSGNVTPNTSAAPGAGLTWHIVQGTTTIATNVTTNGWGVTFVSGIFTVSAPGTAPVGSYRVRYNTGMGTPAGDFNVVQPATSIKAGNALPWEQSVGTGGGATAGSSHTINTINGNKITTVPISEQYRQVSRRLESAQEEMSELVLMRARRLIDDAGLTQGQDRLKTEIATLRRSAATLQVQVDAKHDSVLNAVHFATHVVAKFEGADVWAKRRIVQVLGGSYVLNEKTLSLEKHPLLDYIAEKKEAIERSIRASGKQKTALKKAAVAFGGTNATLTELFRLSLLHSFTRPQWEAV